METNREYGDEPAYSAMDDCRTEEYCGGGTDTTGMDGAAKTFYSTAEIYISRRT